jgi:hypothetical protein
LLSLAELFAGVSSLPSTTVAGLASPMAKEFTSDVVGRKRPLDAEARFYIYSFLIACQRDIWVAVKDHVELGGKRMARQNPLNY